MTNAFKKITFLSLLLLSCQLYSEEASLKLRAQMKKHSDIIIKDVTPHFSIIKGSGYEEVYYSPHLFSVFVNYNGYNSMQVEMHPAEFCNSKGCSSQIIPKCYNMEDGSLINEGILFQYDHNLELPLYQQEFKIGLALDACEINRLNSGNYSSSITINIVENS